MNSNPVDLLQERNASPDRKRHIMGYLGRLSLLIVGMIVIYLIKSNE